MFAVRKLALAGAAAAVGLALTGLVPASAEAASGCYGIGGGKYNCNVWKTAPSYFAATSAPAPSTRAPTTSTARPSAARSSTARTATTGGPRPTTTAATRASG
ncbi:hypothetical protein ACFQ1I_07480 [Kitasatospora arboriphila]